MEISLFFFYLLFTVHADYVPDKRLLGYDCASHIGKYEAYSLAEVGEYDIPDYLQTITTMTHGALLQINDYSRLHVRTCRIEVTRSVYACHSGAFSSHAKVVDNGFARYILELERHQCKGVHELKAITLLGKVHVQQIKANSTQNVPAMLAGRGGHHGDECADTMYHDAYGSWFKVVVTANINLEVKDYDVSVHLESGKVILPSGVRCDLTNEFCINLDGSTVYWDAIQRENCGNNRYSILYKGPMNKTTEKRREETPLYSLDTSDVIFAFSHKGVYDICAYKFIRTEHPKLFIVELEEGEDIKFLTTVPTEDLDILTYVNSKFIYVEKHIKRQMNALYRDVITQKCNLEQKVLKNLLSIGAHKPDEFAFLLKGRPGYIGILGGEVMYVAKCTPVLVEQRESKDCFNELAVSRNGEPLIITPRTRIS